MVTEWLIEALATAAAFLIDLLPDWTVPDWFTGLAATMEQIVGYAVQLGNWFPLDAIGAAAAGILLATGISLAVRIGRMGLSFLTLGGGAV